MATEKQLIFRLILFFLVSGISAVAALGLWPCEYTRMVSPSGAHVAIIKYHGYQNFLTVFAGQSGDKKGWIVIQERDGRELGSADLPMVQMGTELVWLSDSADLPLIGTWKF